MIRRSTKVLALFVMFAPAGCGGAAATTAPSAAPSSAPSAAAAACTPSTAAGTVAVSIKDFEFAPAAITAKVGDVITFTNAGGVKHSATLDVGDCTTGVLAAGAAGGLTFSAAGTYPFHCQIHSAMTGTIEIS